MDLQLLVNAANAQENIVTKITLSISIFQYALQNLGALRTVVQVGIPLDKTAMRLLTELKTTQTLRGFTTAEEANLEAIILEFHRCFNAS